MKVATAKQAAIHECAHAVALAVCTSILTESIYMGCKPDGTCAAGVNGVSVPSSAGSAEDWMIFYLSGSAAEKLFDPDGANREGSLRDDIVAERILRVSFRPQWNGELMTVIEEKIANLMLGYWARIEELAAALLAESPRTVAVFAEQRHVYKLGAIKIWQIMSRHALQPQWRSGANYTDAHFTKLLERHAVSVRIVEASPILAAEYYHHRRFAEAKRFDPHEILDHNMWVNHYGSAKAEILER